jgi:hypothetical protein
MEGITIKSALDLANEVQGIYTKHHQNVKEDSPIMNLNRRILHSSSLKETVELVTEHLEIISAWMKVDKVFNYSMPDKDFMVEVVNKTYEWVKLNLDTDVMEEP